MSAVEVAAIARRPLFSVIVNAYNVRGYIEDALASIKAQTFEDYEVILVDDGSTDGTVDVLRSFASSEPRACMLARAHQGLLLARRAGLRAARGTYVLFLDADDCLHKRALQRCAETIGSTGADIVMFRYSREADFSEGEETGAPAPGLYRGAAFQEMRERLCRAQSVSIWGKAFRRSCIDVEDDYAPYADLVQGEDLFQNLPIFDRASSLVCLSDVLYFYRANPASLTADFQPGMLDDYAVVCRRLREYARSWGAACGEQALAGEAGMYRFALGLASTVMRPARAGAFEQVRRAMLRDGALSRAFEAPVPRHQRLLFSLLLRRRWLLLQLCISFGGMRYRLARMLDRQRSSWGRHHG